MFQENTNLPFPPPPFRCPSCGLPYWIVRECDGTFDHATGKRLPHTPVKSVPAYTVSKRP